MRLWFSVVEPADELLDASGDECPCDIEIVADCRAIVPRLKGAVRAEEVFEIAAERNDVIGAGQILGGYPFWNADARINLVVMQAFDDVRGNHGVRLRPGGPRRHFSPAIKRSR